MFEKINFEDVKYFCLGMVERVKESETVKVVTRKVAGAAASAAASFVVTKKLKEWYDKPTPVKTKSKGLTDEDTAKTIEIIA